jgi:hypothetical protein
MSDVSTTFPLIWHCDDYGAANLLGPNKEHLWIHKRPVYCDRGHWELASTGLIDTVQPALYFHRLETAQREAELWLARSLGRPVPEGDVHCPTTWKDLGGHRWETEADGPGDQKVVCRLERSGTEANPVWTWTIPQGLSAHPGELDASDAFPRHFLRAAHAVDEVACFLAWRLRKIPTETPKALHRPDERVAPKVREHLEAEAIPAARRPKP